jgi:LPS-assembly protein
LRLPFEWAAGFVRFIGGYEWTQYDLEDVPVGDDDQPIRRIWTGSVDSGLYLERDSQIFGTPVLQTLEPRLYYLYTQFRNQDELPEFDTSELSFTFDQLFRDNRFAGIDRIGDANQMTAAVTTRWLSGQTGIERLRVSVGQIFYFDDRNVTLSGVKTADDEHATSAYAGEVAAAVSDHLNFLSSGTWDPNGGEWQEAGVGLQYRADNRHILNLAYRRRTDIAPLIKQSDVSMYWSMFRQWAWIARFDYDLEEHRTIEALAGLEYSDCCWQLRTVWRKYASAPGGNLTPDAQSDEGIFFQIVFKGLAGVGGRIDSMMKSGIPGYVPEEH